MSRWYRAYEGTTSDPKIAEAAAVAGCSRSVAIAAWHALLESAASTQDGGRFDTTARRVAVALGEKPADVQALFDAFTELAMIDGNGIAAWKRRQFESDSSTERSRKHRQRQKDAPETTSDADATLQQRSATPPEAETETEKNTSSLRSDGAGLPAPMADPARSKRGCRLPADWQPSSDDTAFAGSLSMSANDIATEAAKFRDYWHAKAGQGAVKTDWPATWRNWTRKSASDLRARNDRTRTNANRSYESPVTALLRREAGEMRGSGGFGVSPRYPDHDRAPGGFDPAGSGDRPVLSLIANRDADHLDFDFPECLRSAEAR